ncbi:MAG: respiratory nitrate reductase subunit gamma [Firmicutes bacterium]|nr:respiratory nitrate reductase subunit gamma [Bacillota bacterium]MCL5040392.1 respiratory nitrate reductase subunit gamma [Bacillota bacterium]
MDGLIYFVGVVLPYVTLLVFSGGFIYQIVRLARAPLHLHWELFPYPETLGGQVSELATEVATLRSLYLHHRKLWGRSLLMHWGIYLQVLWLLLVLGGWEKVSWPGFAGGLACLFGALGIAVWRYTDPEMRTISSPADYLNLFLVALIPLVGLITGFYGQADLLRSYLWGIASFHPIPPANGPLALNILLIQCFLLYLPFGRMAHFAAKYFTYHKVKWGEVSRHA